MPRGTWPPKGNVDLGRCSQFDAGEGIGPPSRKCINRDHALLELPTPRLIQGFTIRHCVSTPATPCTQPQPPLAKRQGERFANSPDVSFAGHSGRREFVTPRVVVRTEEHIEDRKYRGIVLVLMFRQPTVMHPVHLWRGQEPAHTSESDADIGMIEHSPIAFEESYHSADNSTTGGVEFNQDCQRD